MANRPQGLDRVLAHLWLLFARQKIDEWFNRAIVAQLA